MAPAYEKIKAKLMDQIGRDQPKFCAISIDAWSAHHKGYMGFNVHYIHNFVRKRFNLACSHFPDRHTAVNIWKFVKGNCNTASEVIVQGLKYFSPIFRFVRGMEFIRHNSLGFA